MSPFKISIKVLEYGTLLFVTSGAALTYAYYNTPSDEEKIDKYLKDPAMKKKIAENRKELQEFFNKMKSKNDKEQNERFDTLLKKGTTPIAVDVSKNKDCEELLKKLHSDPKLSKILEKMAKNNSNPVIECKCCSETGVEGSCKAYLMDSKPNKIVLCTNRNKSYDEFYTSLIHELVHSYDMNINKINLSTCKGLAYSEIRAARSAECRHNYMFNFMKNSCIRDRANRCTKNLFPEEGRDCVSDTFEKAMSDKLPFEEDSMTSQNTP